MLTLVHDLKTPTFAQFNTLNMLKNGVFGNLNTEQKQMVCLTQESCRYMSNLIGNIMESYGYDYGQVPLVKSDFDIKELIFELCKETKTLCENNHQCYIIHNQSDVDYIYADKFQIRRVILNLLSNAITYGKNGSKIEITLVSDGSGIEFSVKNMGKYIQNSELVTLFDKFKKSKFSQINHTGTGLGLYVVKKIVEQHGGRVFARSEKDGCCTFGFEIPNVIKSDNKRCRSQLKSAS
jgi:K+-sensing histidine kinase KdpD